MAIITVSRIELREGELQVWSDKSEWINLHYQQGEIGGAYAVYSVAMCLLYGKIVGDLKAKGRANGDRLLHELFDKYGMVRGGFCFKDLRAIVEKYKKKSWRVDHYSDTPKRCVEGIRQEIDDELTPIIGIDYSDCEYGHALLAVAYEWDERDDKVIKIFCLDPGAPAPKTAIWNSYIDVTDLRKPSIHVNDDPKYVPSKCRLTEYLIIHDKDRDFLAE